MHDHRPVAAGGGRGLSCRPASLPATGRRHRAADRVLAPVHALGTGGFVLVVLAGFVAAGSLPDPAGTWVAAVLYLTIGAYCSLNFWRCREAHCVVTGIGFSVLGLAGLAAAAGLPTVVSANEGPIVLGVLVTGCVFEAGWRWRHGNNAVRL